MKWFGAAGRERKREDDLIAVSPTGPCCANKAQQRREVGKFIGPSVICPRITTTVGKSCNWSIFKSQDGGGLEGGGMRTAGMMDDLPAAALHSPILFPSLANNRPIMGSESGQAGRSNESLPQMAFEMCRRRHCDDPTFVSWRPTN